MSGIVGILHLDGAPVDRPLLERLTDFQSFRGPDARQVWFGGQVGFGHTLLRTTEEAERESQPLTLDGKVWIVADARVDAQRDLRAALEAKGQSPAAGAPDVELILRAYHAWGEDCVEYLLGDFAFAIWDGPRRRLFCARDHMGVKPFYYAHIGSVVIFSNTLDCIRQHPAVSNKLNDLAIADFLLFEWNQDPTTTSFADILRLPPAHTAVWSESGLDLRRYWTLPIDEPLFLRRADDYCDRFRELLGVVVGDRLRTNRIGVFMSGGLDSTTLAATARQLTRHRGDFHLLAITDIDDIKPEEGEYAKAAADHLGIPIHFHKWDDFAIDIHWERTPFHMEEPFCNAWQFLADQSYWKWVESHSRVFFWGEGPDNALRFEPRPYIRHLLEEERYGELLHAILLTVASLRRPPFWGRISRRWRKPDPAAEPQPAYPDWLNQDFEKRLRLRDRWFETAGAKFSQSSHPIHPQAHASLQAPLWPVLFESFEPGKNPVCVEVRHPFVDLRMFRFLLSIPVLPWCHAKYLTRRAMRGALPPKVLHRRKTGNSGKKIANWIASHGLVPFLPFPGIVPYVNPRAVPDSPVGNMWTLRQHLRVRSLNHWLQYSLESPYNSTDGGRRYELDSGPRNLVTKKAL